MMSMPTATWCLTASATAFCTVSASSLADTGCPCSLAIIICIRLSGRGKLPVWVVRILVVLRLIVLSPSSFFDTPPGLSSHVCGSDRHRFASLWLNTSGQHTFVRRHRCIYLFVNDHIKERRHIRLQGFAHPDRQLPRIGDPVTTSAKCACNHTVVNIYEIVHMGDDVVIVVVLLLMVLERQGTIIHDHDENRDMTPQRSFEFAQMIPKPPISRDARNVTSWRAEC